MYSTALALLLFLSFYTVSTNSISIGVGTSGNPTAPAPTASVPRQTFPVPAVSTLGSGQPTVALATAQVLGQLAEFVANQIAAALGSTTTMLNFLRTASTNGEVSLNSWAPSAERLMSGFVDTGMTIGNMLMQQIGQQVALPGVTTATGIPVSDRIVATGSGSRSPLIGAITDQIFQTVGVRPIASDNTVSSNIPAVVGAFGGANVVPTEGLNRVVSADPIVTSGVTENIGVPSAVATTVPEVPVGVGGVGNN